MGYGLQKGSPVQLTLGKDNYEALIERHGQWIRWRTAVKCPCTQKDTMQPDPRCPRCKGIGVFYSYQKEIVVTQTLGIIDNTGVLEVSEEYETAALDTVYDHDGKKYPATKHGVYISLETAPQKGKFFYVVMLQKTLRRVRKALCENTGGGYYRIQGLQSRKEGIDGLYHTAPGDIQKIEKVADANGLILEIGELRTDMFTVKLPSAPDDEDPPEIVEPLTAYGIEYIPPFILALQSQNLEGADEKMVTELKGDGICSFPYNCDIGEDDTLTVLAGSFTKKDVINRVDSDFDVIDAYFVSDITSCTGINRDYRKGVDFIIAGTNRIKWLCDDAPIAGEAYSITYQICPTYKVIKAIPQIRTSENQRLPKKSVVKLHAAYGEKRGINQQ
jgi:hypothetical protein